MDMGWDTVGRDEGVTRAFVVATSWITAQRTQLRRLAFGRSGNARVPADFVGKYSHSLGGDAIAGEEVTCNYAPDAASGDAGVVPFCGMIVRGSTCGPVAAVTPVWH